MTHKVDWEEAEKKAGYFTPPTYAEEGFIHTSRLEQILPTANRLYKDAQDLVLLVIDEGKVDCEIKEEPNKSGEMFAHIYGPLIIKAVDKVLEFRPNEEGIFNELPKGIEVEK